MIKLTREEIDACATKKGGHTRTQLAEWGIPWPPPHGWRKALMAGSWEGLDFRADMTIVELHDLLRTVVSAVVTHGHADDLYEFPAVLAYFGARLPAPEEIADHWKGRPSDD